MYFFIGILVVCCALLRVTGALRRKAVIRKIDRMGACEKCTLLNSLIKPFGFAYLPVQDIMTSTVDAWQREFGYRSLYDRAAVRFHMVIDCEPVYFNYDGRTWMIELWKGQYGLNTGGEIGIYRADSIVDSSRYKAAAFKSVPDREMLPVYMKLRRKGCALFGVKKRHWWLTGFCVGEYSEPEELVMDACLLFPDEKMLQSFVRSLWRMGYRNEDVCICKRMVHVIFDVPHSRQPRYQAAWRCRIAQWSNRLLCLLYQCLTRPFCRTGDKVLFLYYFCPFIYRQLTRFQRRWQKKRRKL